MTELQKLKNEVEEYKKIQIIFENKIKKLQQMCSHDKYEKMVSQIIPGIVAYKCTYCGLMKISDGDDEYLEKKL